MAFNWTYPQPLDPNQPSLIGGKLRNVIGTFAVYIQELCDAVNTLRQNIGQAPYVWTIYRPEVGDTLLYEHYRQLQLRLDALIMDYDFNSVVDILGRGWSDYFDYRNYAKYAIIQDFRDVCDALIAGIERWKSSPRFTIFPSPNTTAFGYKAFDGDLGEWRLIARKEASIIVPPNITPVGGELNCGIINEENHRFFCDAESSLPLAPCDELGCRINNYDMSNILGYEESPVSENCILDANNTHFQCKYINKEYEATNTITFYDTSLGYTVHYTFVPYTVIKLQFEDIDDPSYYVEPFRIIIADKNYFSNYTGIVYYWDEFEQNLVYSFPKWSESYRGWFVLFDINTSQIYFPIYDHIKSGGHINFKLVRIEINSYVETIKASNWIEGTYPRQYEYYYTTPSKLSYELDDIGITGDPSFSIDI